MTWAEAKSVISSVYKRRFSINLAENCNDEEPSVSYSIYSHHDDKKYIGGCGCNLEVAVKEFLDRIPQTPQDAEVDSAASPND
jgi:hypothetical protein